MPVSKRIRYNVGWALLGNSVFAAAQWAVIVLIARVGSPEMVGAYSFALAVAAPIFMLANLNLRAYQATDVRDDFHFGQYLSVRLVTSFAAICLVAGLCMLGIVQAAHAKVILAVSFAKTFETLSDACYGLFQRHEELDLIAHSLVLRGLLGFIGMACGLAAGGSVASGALGIAVSWLLVLILLDAPRARRFIRSPLIRVDAATLELIRRAAPLGLVMLMLTISQNIPIYVIEYVLGTKEVGFYSSVAYFLIAGRLVSNAVSQSSSPRLARLSARGHAAGFRRLLHLNLLLGFGLGAAGVLISASFGGDILRLAYGENYSRYALLLTCTMAASGVGFTAAFLGAALTALRMFRVMVGVNALSLLVTALLCCWAIPNFGLLGAPMAIGAAFLVKTVVNMVAIERFLCDMRPVAYENVQHT